MTVVYSGPEMWNSHILCKESIYLKGSVYPFPQSLRRMYPLICKTPRSIARKEMVLMAFDLNYFRNVLLTPISLVTYRVAGISP